MLLFVLARLTISFIEHCTGGGRLPASRCLLNHVVLQHNLTRINQSRPSPGGVHDSQYAEAPSVTVPALYFVKRAFEFWIFRTEIPVTRPPFPPRRKPYEREPIKSRSHTDLVNQGPQLYTVYSSISVSISSVFVYVISCCFSGFSW